MKKLAGLLTILCVFAGVFGFAKPETIYAAGTYNITYQDLAGNVISTATVDDPNPLGTTIPAEADLLVWIYDDCREATAATVPASDMVITAIHNADVSASGTLDSGNITWYILNNKLYVTGNGTISIADRKATGVTKTYTAEINQINVKYPSIMYSWLKAPSVGDEQGDGYGAYSVPVSDEYTYNVGLSNAISFPNQTISYPATAILDAAPWNADAATITDAYFSDDVTLNGNFTLYFNLTSSTVLPSQMSESAYKELKNIYMYADTSTVNRMAGMFAYCPKLENIYLRDGATYDMSTCEDMSLMFYGDEKLTCVDDATCDSILNCMANTGNVTDMRYAFFDCKALNFPSLRDLNTANVEDMSYIFAGCENIGLVCDSSGAVNDLSGWDTGKVFSMAGAFAAPTIDLTAAEPITNTWGKTTATVVNGKFDLSKWDLTTLQTAFLMFGQNHGLTDLVLSGNAPALTDIAGFACWCDSLNTVSFAGANTPALTESVCAFFESGVADATGDFSGWVLDAMTDMRYMFYHSGFKTLNFDSTNPALLQEGRGIFANCNNLTSLGGSALSTWTLPLCSDTSYMFNGDSMLTAVNTSGWRLNNDQTIEYMFSDCSSLGGLDTSSWEISSALTNMDCAFYNCSSVPALDLRSWNVSGVTNAFYALGKMAALSTLDTSGLNFSALQVANGMFRDCYSLGSVDLYSTSGNALQDAAGMFYGDVSLTSASVKDLIKDNAVNISYFASGCSALQTLDISGWNTGNAQWMQGMFDGDATLSAITLGTNFSTANAKSTGAMFRNNNSQTNDSLQSFLTIFNPVADQDLYEMFANTYLLESADLTGKNFAAATNYNRMFVNDDNLVTIKLPASFMSGITDSTNYARNAFYCTVLTPTDLTYDDVTLSAILKNYDWYGDNRIFIDETDATINNVQTLTYKFSPSTPSTAVMKLDAESTFHLKNGDLPLSYAWKYGSTAIAGETDPDYTATRDEIGSYTVSTYLPDLVKSYSIEETFSLSAEAGAASITANYTGDAVPVGSDYSKDKVSVVATYTDGTSKTLTSDQFTVDSQKVTKNGNNNTYTATYVDDYGSTFTDTFNVPGKRVVGSIDAKYIGPTVSIGKDYDPNYVVLTAYYADDTSKSEGFKVTPSSLSGKTVTKAGTNTFTAYYNDPTSKTFSANFDVPGYESANVSGITATYTGPSIVIGNNYDKGKVKVTIHYSDGTPDAATTSFTVDDLLVKQVGANTYTAAYTAPSGISYETKFTVPGIASTTPATNGTSGGSAGTNGTSLLPSTAPGVTTTSVGTVIPATTASAVPPIVALAQTGDNAPIIALFVIILVALTGLCLIILIKKGKLHFSKKK